jgi:Domain of unknown function (DUF4304)
MGAKELAEILNEILTKDGFKKKGNSWLFRNDAITKMVHLQKSNFSNRFYINYGYIINSLPLQDLEMHLFKGFGSRDISENQKIIEVLDLDNSLSDNVRSATLNSLFRNNLLGEIREINTEDDIKNEFLKMGVKTLVPSVVRKHFKIM